MELTRAAVERLRSLILEHPENPIVRVQVKDVGDQRLVFSITLEDRAQPDDEAQTVDGLTVTIPRCQRRPHEWHHHGLPGTRRLQIPSQR